MQKNDEIRSSDQTPLISSKLVTFKESTSSKTKKSTNGSSRPLVTRKVEINMAPARQSTIWTANRYSMADGDKQDSSAQSIDIPELDTDIATQPVVMRRMGPENGWCFWLFLALVCVMMLMGAVLLAMMAHDKYQRHYVRR
jgi:hypothetical protein